MKTRTNPRPAILWLALLALVLGTSSTLLAADRDVCLRYPVETVDSGLDVDFEDYYALNDQVWPYWKARGAAYQVLDPNDPDVIIQQGYASDVNGCFVIPDGDMPPSGEVGIVFYLDSLLFGQIRVRTRSGSPTNCNDDPFADHSGEPEFCQPFVSIGDPVLLSDTDVNYIDFIGSLPEVTLQALAAFPTFWWHHFDTGSFDYDFTITVRHRDGCQDWDELAPCSNAGWYGAGDDLEILINIDDQTEHKYRQKFLMGHEVGHAFEKAYQTARHGTMNGTGGSYFLNQEMQDPDCASGAELHSLTSIEYTSAALNEGFAHFVSADSYNDHNQTDGRFTYYKGYLGFPEFIALEGLPAFDAANPHRSNRFAERVCAVVPENAGTELDWMRFFWDLHTVGGGADDEHHDLLELRVDAAFRGTNWDSENGYDLLEDNACNGSAAAQSFQAAFLDFAGSDDGLGGNGVEPTGMIPSCP